MHRVVKSHLKDFKDRYSVELGDDRSFEALSTTRHSDRFVSIRLIQMILSTMGMILALMG